MPGGSCRDAATWGTGIVTYGSFQEQRLRSLPFGTMDESVPTLERRDLRSARTQGSEEPQTEVSLWNQQAEERGL